MSTAKASKKSPEEKLRVVVSDGVVGVGEGVDVVGEVDAAGDVVAVEVFVADIDPGDAALAARTQLAPECRVESGSARSSSRPRLSRSSPGNP